MAEKNLTLKEAMILGTQHQQKGNLKAAKKIYEDILKINPNYTGAHNNLGNTLKELGEYQKAIGCYEKAIQINPNHASVHNNLGNSLKELGEHKKAISSYQKAIQLNPNHASVHSNLGLVFHELNEFEKAKSCYEKAIQINPNSVNAHNNLGIVLKELGEFQKAISCYEKAIQINPNYAGAYNNNGIALKKLGEFQKAISCYQTAISYYEKAIKINPNHADTHSKLGSVFKELGEYQKAKSCYEKSIEINPNHADTHSNLGTVFKELRKYQEATSCFEKAIKLNPNHAKAYNHLGILFRRHKEHQKAKSCFEKAIEINPNHADTHNNLGSVFQALGEYQKAINCYQKVNSSGSRAALLECTYLLNGIEDYNKILERFSADDPCNIEIAAFASYVAQKKGTKNIYPFCKNSLDFVLINNLKNEFTNSKAFSKNLLQVLAKKEYIWEPFQSNVKGGSRTLGLSLYQKDLEIVEFKKLIEKQIAIYREKYKHKEDYLITKWPLKSSIALWHNKLSKQGYLTPHIHASGWLSGVFYLKVPKLLNKDEGSIKLSLRFSRYGHDYPDDKNLPNLIHSPKDFDIILFPSSTYHQTIPFNSQDERHSLAFDLMPII